MSSDSGVCHRGIREAYGVQPYICVPVCVNVCRWCGWGWGGEVGPVCLPACNVTIHNKCSVMDCNELLIVLFVCVVPLWRTPAVEEEEEEQTRKVLQHQRPIQTMGKEKRPTYFIIHLSPNGDDQPRLVWCLKFDSMLWELSLMFPNTYSPLVSNMGDKPTFHTNTDPATSSICQCQY